MKITYDDAEKIRHEAERFYRNEREPSGRGSGMFAFCHATAKEYRVDPVYIMQIILGHRRNSAGGPRYGYDYGEDDTHAELPPKPRRMDGRRSLTPEEAREALLANDVSAKDMAERLGVRPQVIRRLRKGDTYKFVHEELEREEGKE